jgi:hypothetical protein
VESAACGDVVVVLVAAEDDVVVELTFVVVLGVAGFSLLPHAAKTIESPSITDPAMRCVATFMQRTYGRLMITARVLRP